MSENDNPVTQLKPLELFGYPVSVAECRHEYDMAQAHLMLLHVRRTERQPAPQAPEQGDE